MAKAPLLIGCDLNTVSSDSLNILKNKDLIDINQDKLGQQAHCVQNCDFSSNSTVSVYVSQNLGPIGTKTDAYIAVMAVNWDDHTPDWVTLDLVALGAAFSKYDTCTIYNTWTKITETTNGDVQSFGELAPHDNLTLKI